MKTLEQRKFEASKRQAEIARKTKQLGVKQSGNVKTSWNRNTKEFLLNMGFYQKGENSRPSKTPWVEKRLKPNVIEIDVRKK